MTGILIMGGTGVFGSRLAKGLLLDGFDDIIISGRNATRVAETSKRLGCRGAVLDRNDVGFENDLARLSPNIVVDAAGPFQAYIDDPYRVHRAALTIGADSLDLSDDGDFTAGIKVLDARAKQAGCVVRSGVSSVPAISAAAVKHLANEMERIHRIESAILPGNRAPRGHSVMSAILSQIGRPISSWPDTSAWIGKRRYVLEKQNTNRSASPIGAPDILLFPAKFKVSDVRFRAGLELRILHNGLAFLASLRRWKLIPRPERFTTFFQIMAKRFENFGTDEGGMIVDLIGERKPGVYVKARWILWAQGGKGPNVPLLPARAVIASLVHNDLPPGASASLSDITLEQLEKTGPELELTFDVETSPWIPLFESVLENRFSILPAAVRKLHDTPARRLWRGKVDVSRGQGWLANRIADAFSFPTTAQNADISVAMTPDEDCEKWVRKIDHKVWRSTLRTDPQVSGRVWETFGPFSFAIDFLADGAGLRYPVTAGRFLGVPIPPAFLPVSETLEAQDHLGRATFDVALSLPFLGPIVRYQGWLEPGDQPIMGDHAPSTSS